MKKIIPNLWFDHEAEEAASFYVSIFPNSKIKAISRYGKAASEVSGQPEGSVLTVDFELDGNPFVALNGGPMFRFTEAVSFMVECRDQEEVDYFWSQLTAGGSEQPCGWLKDRFGLSWQVVPAEVSRWMTDPDETRRERVMQAMLQMKKLDLATLRRAYEEG